MKRNWKQCLILGTAGVIVMGAGDLMPKGSRARADEPTEWCLTHQYWVASGGSQGGAAGGSCPTYGTCDSPSVRDSWIPGPSTPTVTLRIKFHIVCSAIEPICAASLADVADQMVELNSDFAPYRIQFDEQSQADFIYSDDYFWRPDFDEVDEMKLNYADDPGHQINVFVTHDGSFGYFPWMPDPLGKLGGIIIKARRFGAGWSDLTHEIGHNLGLWHTHRGVSDFVGEPCYEDDHDACDCPCYERAGVPSDITGDFASDTPPTPTNDDCEPPGGIDSCSGVPWGATQPENYMGYGDLDPEAFPCWTEFSPQQAGRMHCWVHDVLSGWIACTTDEDCDDRDVCTGPDLCVDGMCQMREYPIGTCCQNGIDDDSDGYADCNDVADCEAHAACYCDDNGGNSPLVCVNWGGPVPPEHNLDFVIDSATDPDNPTVTFRTGNDGWVVWSQASRTNDTPANLGHIKVDPTLPSSNFSLAVAHGPSPGAADVSSISLIDTGWTGQSNLVGGTIAGDLGGDLILQESGGSGGAASFTIGGSVTGDVTIHRLIDLGIAGDFSGTMAINDLAGPLSIGHVSGTIHVYDDLEEEGSILVDDDLDGGLIVEGDVNGAIVADADGSQGGDIFGFLIVTGVYNGELCAANLSATQPLPPSIYIGCGIGLPGTICGEVPVCPASDIIAADPTSGTKDARQPYPEGTTGEEVLLSERQGIGSPNEDARPEDEIMLTLDSTGLRAISHNCWSLCETDTEPVDTGTPPLEDNRIVCVKETEIGGDTYQIILERPISGKNWTTIEYAGASEPISYASLPADVNHDGTAAPIDIIKHVDCCLNWETSGCDYHTDLFACDTDHSGVVAPADLLALIDLLNGAGNFIAWNGLKIPATNSCLGSSMMAGGPSSETMYSDDENQLLADWLIKYLASADPKTDEKVDEIEIIVGGLQQWCVGHFTKNQKTDLADRLTDKELFFASDFGAKAAAMVADALGQ